MSQRIAVLKETKHNLLLAEYKLYYNTLIKLKILCGSCTWSTALEENVQQVSKLQKWGTSVILDADIGERSEGLFRQLDWLPLKDEVNLQKCSLIFRCIINENDCPSYITQQLPGNSYLHSWAGHYAKYNLVCPHYDSETEGGHTFQARGVKLWNVIPLDVHEKDTAGS